MKKALIGYGGHAREVACQINENVTFFVEDKYLTKGSLPMSEFNPDEFKVMVAIANPIDRELVVKSLPTNTKFFTFVHPTALLMDTNITIGEGSFIGAYSIITTNIKLGKHSILNRGCHIGHDSEIGDFLSMMPNSVISGDCKIGNRVYFGTNSSVREKIKISDNVILGLNSGVINDIIISGTYVGTPAKRIK